MNRIQFLKKIALAAGISLAMALTFGCMSWFDDQEIAQCGSEYYYSSDKSRICENGKFVSEAEMCNGKKFNSATQFCQKDNEYGYGGTIKDLCGGKTYTIEQHCNGSAVEEQCGGDWYNPSNKFCLNYAVKDLCDGKTYTEYQRCGAGNVVETECGSGWYSPSSLEEYCKDGTSVTQYGSVAHGGKTYKTMIIVNQTWMAENLNYDAPGSKCYGNLPANCEKYGRLYDWVTAMALENYTYNDESVDCSAIYCNTNSYTVQGICPSGWHIPKASEWSTLRSNANSGQSGSNLRAVSGWDVQEGPSSSSSKDAFGFKALPGGYYSDDDFDYAGQAGGWWSTTENSNDWTNSTTAQSAVIRYDSNDMATSNNYSKADFLSVRCVKN